MIFLPRFCFFLGEYKGDSIERSYSDEIRCCDIFTPTYLNCGSNPRESTYIHKVRNYHKKNSGIEQADAEKLYLSKIKSLPFYPYKLYHHVKTNGHRVCIGLTAKGLCLIAEGGLERFLEPSLLAEYPWTEIYSCLKKKHKLHVGVFSKSEMDGIILKVEGSEAEQLLKDIPKFRDGLLTKPVALQKKASRPAGAFRGQIAKKTFKLGASRKISDFAWSFENSFMKLRERTLTGSSTNDA